MDPAASSTDGMFSMENDSLKLLDDLDESISNGTAGEFAGVNAQVGVTSQVTQRSCHRLPRFVTAPLKLSTAPAVDGEAASL